jgi:hypothetical protein
MDVQQLQHFLGWSLVINFSLLVFISVMIIFFKGLILKIHGSLFDMEKKELNILYVNFISNYKLLIIIFSLVPYLVVRYC